ncbi:Threonylcarbamoyl-AMP synthase [BD1-7 clade bacterium]|uniref:Threonylcarbamoyl-AMP synthase n=1 Tax=BD1-7 clade bacterium TaxID=2029982 RepID=A0A5S9QF92_9GAMM|nr:Threonylcarbamoyl-AMP synthase [BD1-7 clade bacterium]
MNIQQSVSAIRHGEVIAYPTETVWGLGCDPFCQQAVERLLYIKDRPVDKGLIMVVADIAQLRALLPHLSAEDLQAVHAVHTPTTFLYPVAGAQIPDWVTGRHTKVAIRISQHTIVQQLCLAWGGPLVSTSANPASCQPATEIFQLKRYFSNTVPICHGRVGGDKPSTIIDIETRQILRG